VRAKNEKYFDFGFNEDKTMQASTPAVFDADSSSLEDENT